MHEAISDESLVNRITLAQARAQLGVNFSRILGYFHEDGVKSVARVEEAMRAGNAASMVIPAHTLKGEARQFGAERLAELAEQIEMAARACVEHHDTPSDMLEPIVSLRPMFEATLALLERESSQPATPRPAGFGRRSAI